MKNYPVHLRNLLNSVIRDMANHPEKFCCNPRTDFTRNRRLPFEKVLSLLLKMGGHSLRDEMLDHLRFKDSPASVLVMPKSQKKCIHCRMHSFFLLVPLLTMSLT